MDSLIDVGTDPAALGGLALFLVLIVIRSRVSERPQWVRETASFAAAGALLGGFLLAYILGPAPGERRSGASPPGSHQANAARVPSTSAESPELPYQRSRGKRAAHSRESASAAETTEVVVDRAPRDWQWNTGDDSRSRVPPEEAERDEAGRDDAADRVPAAAGGRAEPSVHLVPGSRTEALDGIVERLSAGGWVSEARYETGPDLEGLFELYEVWRTGEDFEGVPDPGKHFVDHILEGAAKMLNPEDPQGAEILREAQRALEEDRWADAARLVHSAVQ